MTQETGIPGPVYLAGHTFLQGVTAIEDEPERYESRTLFGDVSIVTDGPDPYDGCADLIVKRRWRLGWDWTEGDYDVHELILAWPDAFDFCPFRPVYEVFSGDGTTTAFVLHRRPFEAFLDPEFWPDPSSPGALALSCKINGMTATPPVIGTADELGHTTVTFATAPAAGTRNLWIRPTPVFLMLLDQGAKRVIGDVTESRSLSLLEA